MTRGRLFVAVGLAGAVVALLTGCRGRPLNGTELPEPWPRPAFRLTDTGGRPFQFDVETRGMFTLLFFGFTSCPDICPATFSKLAAAAARVSPQQRARLKVVFVASDPARDHPDVVRAWLGSFPISSIGLLGPRQAIAAAARASLLPGPEWGTDSLGQPTVAHYPGALVITADDSVRVIFGPDLSVDQVAADLATLLTRYPAGEPPEVGGPR